MAKWGSFAELVSAKQRIDRDDAIKDLITTLRWYADGENYTKEDGQYDLTEVQKDEGDRARAVLRKLGVME